MIILPSRHIDAEVSSQEDSIPSTIMAEGKVAKKNKKRGWVRFLIAVFLWLPFSLIVFTATLWLLLQLPVFQNYLTDKALVYVSNKTDHDIAIKNVRIAWFDQIEVEGFQLNDYKDSVLCRAENVMVNYDLWQLINSNDLSVEEIYLESGEANLAKYFEDEDVNLNVFLNTFKSDDSIASDTTQSRPILLDRITLEDFKFSSHDLTVEPVKNLDLNHLDFQISLLAIQDLALFPDSIYLKIQQFTVEEPKQKINVEDFESEITYTDTQLLIDNLFLNTGQSQIGNSIELKYPSTTAFSSFADSVQMTLNLENTKISLDEIGSIIGNRDLKGDLILTTLLDGKLSDIKSEKLYMNYGRSYLSMDFKAKHLPDLEKAIFDIEFNNSAVITNDLKPFLKEEIPALNEIRKVSFDGEFKGKMKDFRTEANLKTQLGSVYFDMEVEVPEEGNVSYAGHLDAKKVDVGRIMGDTALFQKMSVKGRILGSGLTKETAAFVTDFSASEVGIKKYVYDTVVFRGFLAASHFYGNLKVDDPNCKVNGRANIDLRKTPETLFASMTVDTLFTKKLNLTEQDFFLSSGIRWRQTHLNPDSLQGELVMTKFNLSEDTTRSLSLKRLAIDTKLEDSIRQVNIELPGIKGDLTGQYTFKSLFEFLAQEGADLASYFQFAPDTLRRSKDLIDADLKLTLENANPYLNFFSEDIKLARNTKLDMDFRQYEDADAVFSARLDFDSLSIKNKTFVKNHLDFHASMAPDSEQILASFLIGSEWQDWSEVPHSENFVMEGIWLDNKIEVTTEISQPETKTSLNLTNEVVLYGDSIHLSFENSKFTALDKLWTIDDQNLVSFRKEKITIDALNIRTGQKLISLEGTYSDSLKTDLNMLARNVQLDEFNSFLNLNLESELDADLTLFKRPDEEFQFSGHLNLSDLIYKDIEMGDVSVTSYWDPDKEGVRARMYVDRENVKTINLDGYYYPGLESSFDFDLEFDGADFKMLEVITEGNLSDLEGAANGKLNISGDLEKPVVVGNCEIVEGTFLVDYLQARYNFGGNIIFKNGIIDLENFELFDLSGDKAEFYGEITHNYFKDIVTDFKIHSEQFQFLNTTASDNSLFYGTAEATGDIFVTGPIEDLKLKVNAKTEKGTKFYIPIGGSEAFEQAEFITFVNLSDSISAAQVVEKEIEQGLGLTLDFDLEVTPDAYCELIFDIKTGDIIRGRGKGNLSLILDKNGNFELRGPLTITEGAYNFTANFINKEFIVRNGGTITWYGNPYEAAMNLTAEYRQKASFGSLLGPETEQNAAMTQKYPVLVVLGLQGQMLAPDIIFDIELDESVPPNQELTRLLAQIRNDDQQLKRQVVSLMFFKRFSPLESSFVGGGGSTDIGSSVSEFLTNQISYLASQLDENLEVEVDLTNLDQEGFETFQLRLAYTFMDGRLRVTRGGDFSSAQNQNSSLVNDIIGDWSVEYMLTRDGKLRAKMFSRTNQNFVAQDDAQNMETGLSLRYITSFNNFKDLMGKTRAEAINRREDDEEENE